MVVVEQDLSLCMVTKYIGNCSISATIKISIHSDLVNFCKCTAHYIVYFTVVTQYF